MAPQCITNSAYELATRGRRNDPPMAKRLGGCTQRLGHLCVGGEWKRRQRMTVNRGVDGVRRAVTCRPLVADGERALLVRCA